MHAPPLHMYYIINFCIPVHTEDDVIQDFLWVDSCCKLADKVVHLCKNHHNVSKHYSPCFTQYLLAMVYVYFRRAALPIEQYNRVNFFTAL